MTALDERNATAWYNRGIVLSKLKLTEEAIRDFSRVLEIDPHHVQAGYARAACYNSKGCFSLAIEDYNQALRRDEEQRNSSSITEPTAKPTSPIRNRRVGSMVIGAEEYAKQKENEYRTKLGSPSKPQSQPQSEQPKEVELLSPTNQRKCCNRRTYLILCLT